MDWVVYILRCADETLYTGITNNLENRLRVHESGKGAKYLRGRLPFTLAYRENCADKSTALKRERAIKALSRAEKLNICVMKTH